MWFVTIFVVILSMFLATAHMAQAAEHIQVVAAKRPMVLDVTRVGGNAYVPAEPLLDAFGAHIESAPSGSVSVCVGEDVCALVDTDGTDDRLLWDDDDGGSWMIAVDAAPGLLRAHYTWDGASDALALEPGPTPAETGLAVGDPFPEIALPDMDGRLVSLGGFRGRKVVLFTWASW
jgi:hypothetical protein